MKRSLNKKISGLLVFLLVFFSHSITLYADYDIGDLHIIENEQTINTSSRRNNKIEYINIHYVGAIGDALQNSNYFLSPRNSSAHYFVGYDGTIIQSVDDSLAAWSVGGPIYPNTSGGSVYQKDTNYNSINIEMCVKNSSNDFSASSTGWYFEEATVYSTVKLVQELMKKYNIPIENVVRHFDVVGKYCPNPFVLNDDKITWDIFKDLIVNSNPEELKIPEKTGITLNASGIKYIIGNECELTININNINKSKELYEEQKKEIEEYENKSPLERSLEDIENGNFNYNSLLGNSKEEENIEEGFTAHTKGIRDEVGNVWIKVPENYISDIK